MALCTETAYKRQYIQAKLTMSLDPSSRRYIAPFFPSFPRTVLSKKSKTHFQDVGAAPAGTPYRRSV